VPLVDAGRARTPRLRHVVAVGPGQTPASGVRSFGELIASQPATPPAPVDVQEDELVALPYSSGTTGLPKGVMLTHKNLVINNIQFIACLRLRESDRLMLFLPFYHIYGTMLMGAAVYTGATCVLMERFEPVECLELVQRHRVTLFFVVPPVLLMLSNWPELSKYDLSSLRPTMVGAAAWTLVLQRRHRLRRRARVSLHPRSQEGDDQVQRIRYCAGRDRGAPGRASGDRRRGRDRQAASRGGRDPQGLYREEEGPG